MYTYIREYTNSSYETNFFSGNRYDEKNRKGEFGREKSIDPLNVGCSSTVYCIRRCVEMSTKSSSMRCLCPTNLFTSHSMPENTGDEWKCACGVVLVPLQEGKGP